MSRAGLAIALLSLALSPLGAGATGHGALAMLAFTGVFFLANAVIRPGSVSYADPSAIVLQVMTAGAFAAVLVGLGQTLRALGQIEAEIALEGWLILAAWGIVLGRLVWRRSTGAAAMRKAEAALRVVHDAGRPKTQKKPRRAPDPAHGVVARDAPAPAAPPVPLAPPAPADPALGEALRRINGLSETDTDEAALSRALATVSGAAPLGSVFEALAARAPLCERDRRALAIHVTDPWVAEQRAGKHEPAAAFEAIVTAADAVALTEFATRAHALVDERPEARRDMPQVARLLEIADQIEGDLETEAELLVALAHRLEDLALEDDRDG
ncbi:MAG: hypothetical protein AAGJ91_08135 [Pseudomonadota bacterium]